MKRLVVVFFIAGSLISCSASEKQAVKIHQQRPLMGTVVGIDVCEPLSDQEEVSSALSAVWERLEEISWRMNVYDEKSDVQRINDSSGEQVRIGDDTWFVLEKAMEYWKKTEGAFDVTVWPLIQFWQEQVKSNEFPTQEELDNVLEIIGMEHIVLSSSARVSLKKAGIQVDLGGIAKGYAIDEAARLLRKHKIRNFLIDAGGDMYAGGHNCQGELWRIGIRNPRNTEEIWEKVYVTDKAVTTSGNYMQFMTIQGVKLSHIINPVTGRPQEHISSATVIAPKAIDADALATALTIGGAEKSLHLIDEMGLQYAALIIQDDEGEDKIYPSKNLKKYQR